MSLPTFDHAGVQVIILASFCIFLFFPAAEKKPSVPAPKPSAPAAPAVKAAPPAGTSLNFYVMMNFFSVWFVSWLGDKHQSSTCSLVSFELLSSPLFSVFMRHHAVVQHVVLASCF